MPKFMVTVSETLERHFYGIEVETDDRQHAREVAEHKRVNGLLGDPHHEGVSQIDIDVAAINSVASPAGVCPECGGSSIDDGEPHEFFCQYAGGDAPIAEAGR
jgi:hypothetical protein